MNKKSKEIIVGIILLILLGAGIFLTIKKVTPTEGKVDTSSQQQAIDNQNLKIVKLTKTGFVPSEIRVHKGESVRWLNESGQDGTVNSADHPTHRLYTFLNLGVFSSGSNIQAKFDNLGSFNYHNHLEPSQTGRVIVE